MEIVLDIFIAVFGTALLTWIIWQVLFIFERVRNKNK